ncbi:AP2-like ethylene-responsive transcription factor PLT2 [Linum perenne]
MNNGDLLKSVNYAKFHGVMWYLGKFEAQVWDDSDPRKEGHPVYLGGFDDENMAARAYDLAALKIKGASTTLNFPVTDYEKEIEEMKDVSKDEHLKLLKK